MSVTHLSEGTWEQFAMGELEPARRAEALRHVMTCRQCRTIHRGLRALEDEARAKGLLPAPRSRKRTRWFVGLAVAAAAGLLLLWHTGRPAEDGAVRGSAVAKIVVNSPPTIRVGDRVTWTAVPDAVLYSIDVFTPDGKPSTAWNVIEPAALWRGTAPGSYRWRVTALGEGAVHIASSALLDVKVEP